MEKAEELLLVAAVMMVVIMVMVMLGMMRGISQHASKNITAGSLRDVARISQKQTNKQIHAQRETNLKKRTLLVARTRGKFRRLD